MGFTALELEDLPFRVDREVQRQRKESEEKKKNPTVVLEAMEDKEMFLWVSSL